MYLFIYIYLYSSSRFFKLTFQGLEDQLLCITVANIYIHVYMYAYVFIYLFIHLFIHLY